MSVSCLTGDVLAFTAGVMNGMDNDSFVWLNTHGAAAQFCKKI
jgi:hypothetical protein